jgi:glycosyltransferase involved in cell wall biosynthesis
MKRILIISATYMDLKISSNNRTNFIPQYLHDNGYDVELITSNFNHHRKEHVNDLEHRDYKITLLPEIGYQKNVSIKRILSISSFKKNLKTYLINKDEIDVVLAFIPPHNVAKVCYKFAKKVGAKFIIDVRDLWPEAFKMVIKNNFLYKLLSFPFVIQANKSYKLADEIVAVSDLYKDRATKHNKNTKGSTIYLGTSLSDFDKYSTLKSAISKTDNLIRIVYTGTLGNSYDLITLFKAYSVLKTNYNKKIVLDILGNGPLENKFKTFAYQNNLDINFYGRLEYKKMVAHLKQCDIVINSLVKNASQSIINKHADYAFSGLPVVSNQQTNEYVDLLKKFNAGFTVSPENYIEMAEKIKLLIDNKELRLKMGSNHRRMGVELFDRDIIYRKLIEIIDNKSNEESNQ